MPDETRVEFGWPGAYLGLSLMGRPLPDAKADWDRDAIGAHVTIEAEDFRGEFDALTWSHELAHLQQVLREIDGDVGKPQERFFRLLDADISLTFKLGTRGDLELDVESMRGAIPYKVRLRYTICADQTYIRQWIQVIDRALIEYPPLMNWQMSIRTEKPAS
jgi:hypothetical protein